MMLVLPHADVAGAAGQDLTKEMSSLRYFIIDSEPSAGDTVFLEGPEARHLARVARIGIGGEVVLINGRGGVYASRVTDLIRERVALEIVSAGRAPAPPPVDMAISIIKAPRMETALEKLTELGIRRIIPYISGRSVWRGEADRAERKRERFYRIIESAAKQSCRAWFPEIHPLIDFDGLARLLDSYGRVYLADPGGIPSTEIDGADQGAAVIGVIGPEGGLTDEEYARIDRSRAVRVSLGKNRLRTETAAVCLAFQLASKAV